jgi:predicted aspartyl protease
MRAQQSVYAGNATNCAVVAPFGAPRSWYGEVVHTIALPSSGARAARPSVWLFGLLSAFVGASTSFALDAIKDDGVPMADASLFASPTTRDHVGRVLVPVTINGRGPFRFIVDTGANHSTISPGLARKLGLEPAMTTPILLDGITGSAQVSFVTVERLQAGELTLEGETLPVISAGVFAGADGILGAAGLTANSLVVDFQHNRVAISHNVATAVREQSTRIHALRLTYGLITLEARVGGVRVQAVVDTGAERSLGNLALRDALHSKERPGAVVQVTTVYGATEETELAEIRSAPPISLESLRINDVKILYGDFHIFKVWSMAEKPAMIIGMDILGTVPALGIDFARQDVYVTAAPTGGFNPHDLAPGGALGNSMQKK